MCPRYVRWLIFFLLLAGCKPTSTTAPIPATATQLMPTSTLVATPLASSTPMDELAAYAFPKSIDPAKQYLFYLHGKIVEDQGIHAVSETYGEYEYEAILEKLKVNDFLVISERRPKNAGLVYANNTLEQINRLLEAGVPPENITVIGASKGAYFAATISHLLKNPDINFVLLGFCDPNTVEEMKHNQTYLYGNVLAIYDSADDLAGSCQELFTASESNGITQYDEIVLHIGTGHGILYKPLDDWIVPSVEWARGGSVP